MAKLSLVGDLAVNRCGMRGGSVEEMRTSSDTGASTVAGLKSYCVPNQRQAVVKVNIRVLGQRQPDLWKLPAGLFLEVAQVCLKIVWFVPYIVPLVWIPDFARDEMGINFLLLKESYCAIQPYAIQKFS